VPDDVRAQNNFYLTVFVDEDLPTILRLTVRIA
jgi:hypothetical protein